MVRGIRETVYLCGPMDGVSPLWATEWRKSAKNALNHYYNVIDPTDGIDLTLPNIHTDAYSPENIVLGDYERVNKSSILLVDLREIPMWQRLKNFVLNGHSDPARVGTIMEMAWGIKHYTIGFGKWNSGYFMRFHLDQRVDTLDDALFLLKLRATEKKYSKLYRIK